MPASADRPEAWPAPVGRGKTFEQFVRPPGGPRTSGLAIASLVCGIFGFLCITALVSVGLGLGALVSIAGAPHLRKGRGLAIAGIVLSILWSGSMAAAVLLSPDLRARLQDAPAPPPYVAPGTPMPGPTAPGPVPMMPGLPGVPAPVPPGMPIPMTPLPPRAPSPFYSALSPAAGPLQSQIQVQIAGAESTGRRLVVFFTAEWCAPCRAVKQTLAAPDLVASLSAVQLVEVDVDAFPGADISRVAATMVGRRVDAIPLLCTLRSNLPPVCIDGAAWGEDTDANIRAVLVPFLQSPPSGLTPNVPTNPIPI